MQENLREMESFPGLPRVRRGKAINFFRAAEKEATGNFPVWNGELYLELHRGTYTTQARNKRANRQSEFLLHDAEFLAAAAALVVPDFVYPHADLRRAWELVCLNQFHDIIPGSSITQVYVDSLTQYAEVRKIGEAVKNKALAVLAQAIGGDILLINPTPFAQDGPIFWPKGDPARLPAGLPFQPVDGGLLLDAGQRPPYSVQSLDNSVAAAAPGSLSVSTTHLENDFLRVELNPAGDITCIFDKQHQREVMPPGAIGNQWQAFEDRPLNWDAWDIDIFYDDKQWLAQPAESVTVVEHGPLRATLEIKRRILNSPFTQRVSLSHNSPRLDFETDIDWRERHILLKAAFPVEVLPPTATYEIQWGNVERPIHRNTSWDWAKFETCAQKWVDLSEGDYGVSLLNDCKYGHDIQDASPAGGVIRLSLLRSPTHPDPEADQGEHHFTYSLLPHAGRWDRETIRQAYALNDPLRVFALPQPAEVNPSPPPGSLVSVDRPNVVIETVKQAEDGNGIVVRLYECMRQRGPVTLRTGFPLAGAWRANLLEENETELVHDDDSVEFSIKPYQIVTLRLLPEIKV
jgi:alpha-mannosidase